MSNIKKLGIDLAKNTFSLVGMDNYGEVVLRKALSRKKLLTFVARITESEAEMTPTLNV